MFDVAVFMVSLDAPDRNADFSEAHGGGLPVLSDPSGDAARSFGVIESDGRHPKRFTFYIDRDGMIRHIDRSVSPRSAGPDIARQLERLSFPKLD